MLSLQLKMLLWNEFRQRHGQLLLCLLLGALCILGAVLWTVGNHARGLRPKPFPWQEMAMLYVFIVPVLVAMRTACGEATDRTAAFTRSLPLAPARASWMRLLSGGCVLAAPIVLAATGATAALAVTRSIDPSLPGKWPALMPAGWSGLGQVWFDAVVLAIAAVGCHVQLALLGTLVRRENQAAFLGAVWMILCFFATISYRHSAEPILPQALLFLVVDERGPSIARISRGLAGNLALVVLWSALFIARHGRQIDDPGQGSAWARARDGLTRWLPGWRLGVIDRVRATRFGALAWLAMRQSLPMCLAALAIALVISLMMWTAGRQGMDDWPAWKMTALVWTVMTSMIGILWASVVGVGSVADELDRRCGDFWRTRPIPFWPLFTIKFVVGLVVVAVVLNGPLIAVDNLVSFGSDPPNFYSSVWVYAACALPVQVVMFAQALAWACLLGRVAVGALAALGTMMMVLLAQVVVPALGAFAPMVMYGELQADSKIHGGVFDLSSCGFPGVVAVFALATLAAYLIAGYSLSTYQPRSALERGAVVHRFPGPRRLLRLRQSA